MPNKTLKLNDQDRLVVIKYIKFGQNSVYWGNKWGTI